MIEIGKVCTKIAGRDAGSKCVVVERINDSTVLIDGQTRRRNCNIKHLEPSDSKLDIKKGASHADIIKAFKKINIEIRITKPKPRKERPRKIRKSLSKQKKETKEEKPKKTVKKEEKPKKTVKKEEKPKKTVKKK